MAINVSNLSDYVEQHRLPLLRNAVLGSRTAKEFALQTGCKGETALNLLTTTVSFGDGSSCGWNEAGSSALSQRTIKVGYPKVNMSFCDKTLLKKWTNYEVRVAAGQKNLPFEEDFTNGVNEAVGAALEKALWQGDTTSADANLSKFDGMVKILDVASASTKNVTLSATSITEDVKAVYNKIPAAAFNKGDVVMYMGSSDYREYVMKLVDNGAVVLNNGDGNIREIGLPESLLIPGTNVRVIPVDGLDGLAKRHIVASYRDNFNYGTDMQGDEEKYELWYSQDNREFRLAIEFTAGVQVAFPDMVAYGKEA